MTPEHHKPKFFPQDSETPLKPVNKRNDFDISTELEGFGLQGVRVTDDDLSQLIKDLGLDGDEAADMVRSLGGEASTSNSSKEPEVRVTKENEPGEVEASAQNEDSISSK